VIRRRNENRVQASQFRGEGEGEAPAKTKSHTWTRPLSAPCLIWRYLTTGHRWRALEPALSTSEHSLDARSSYSVVHSRNAKNSKIESLHSSPLNFVRLIAPSPRPAEGARLSWPLPLPLLDNIDMYGALLARSWQPRPDQHAHENSEPAAAAAQRRRSLCQS
jgi:hypothetical protein